MSVTYIRYDITNGRYIAKITKEATDPEPLPRATYEGIKVLSPMEVDMVLARPQMFRYDNLLPEPLAEGVISVSSSFFYPTVENFDELYPQLDDRVYLEARFPTLPQDAPIKIAINNIETELLNFDSTPPPFELTSAVPTLFNIRLTDPRCYAEASSIIVQCYELPE